MCILLLWLQILIHRYSPVLNASSDQNDHTVDLDCSASPLHNTKAGINPNCIRAKHLHRNGTKSTWKKNYEGEIKENRKINRGKQTNQHRPVYCNFITIPPLSWSWQGRDSDKRNSVYSVKTSEILPADFSEPVSELFLSCYQHTRQKAVTLECC